MLTFYRTNIRCSECRMTTRSINTEIKHYAHCGLNEQSAEMLNELKARVTSSLAKRKSTLAVKAAAAEIAKVELQIADIKEAYSRIATASGLYKQGIHKISGSTGLHTVRPFDGSCTCPGYKGHGHCKHLKLARDAQKAMHELRAKYSDARDRLSALTIPQEILAA